jgi:hypothetical protein
VIGDPGESFVGRGIGEEGGPLHGDTLARGREEADENEIFRKGFDVS